MSHQVLARKWRPRHLQDMVGQEPILRMLTNALTHKRLHHAYLFTGTRGIGKTTFARILAKCLNCMAGISATPCETCQACIGINESKFSDLIEVDAASRTKVEDTRDLLETIQYTPAQGRYKICLIDEVHMLSGHSFNALLKTLEEPPPHVIFLLATTDPHKLPLTILSRCLQFNLHPLSPDKIISRLTYICEAEKISIESTALELIAEAAKGSMRDALSLLDQAIIGCNHTVSLEATREMLGYVSTDLLIQLLKDLHAHQGENLLATIQTILKHSPDVNQVLSDLLTLLHRINLQHCIPTLDNTPEIQLLSKQFSANDIQLFYQIGLIGRRDLAYAPTPALGFEMTILRMLAFKPTEMTPSSVPPIRPTEKKISPPTVTQTQSKTTPSQNNWHEIFSTLKLSGMLFALASHCTLKNITDKQVDLLLSEKNAVLLTPHLKERLQKALTDYFNRPIKLNIHLIPHLTDTPAEKKTRTEQHNLDHATRMIHQNASIQKIIETFDAKLEPNSIESLIESKNN